MPTEAQLRAEPWWNAERPAPAIVKLAKDLAQFYGAPMHNFGIRGDIFHLAGYHRSRAWVLNSEYNTGGKYSVSRTTGDAHGGDPNHCCALDIQLSRDKLVAMCKRLDAAVRAGRLEKITEWYGTFGDDDRVDGYDNIANRSATSDKSHLWHLHISFDRGSANRDHADLYKILTGGDAMTPEQEKAQRGHILAIAHRAMAMLGGHEEARFRIEGEPADRREPNELKAQLTRIETMCAVIGDPATLAAIVAACIVENPNILAAILDTIRDEIKREMAPERVAEATLSLLKEKL